MTETAALTLTTPSDREIAWTREFAAPRHLVFAALTQPRLVSRWLLGPPGWTMPVCEIDLRVGGTYQYVWRSTDGKEMRLHGEFREVAPPDRIVATENFAEPWYPDEAVTTTVLTERDGRTTLTGTVLFTSREGRDTALKSGMDHGMAASYERLEEILAATPAGR